MRIRVACRTTQSVVILNEKAIKQRYKHKFEAQLKKWLVDPNIRIYEGGPSFRSPGQHASVSCRRSQLVDSVQVGSHRTRHENDQGSPRNPTASSTLKPLIKHLANDQVKDAEFLTTFLHARA